MTTKKTNSEGISGLAEKESQVVKNSIESSNPWLTQQFESIIGGKDPLDPLAAQSSLKAGFLVTLGVHPIS